MSDYYDTYKYTCPHCGEPAQVVEGLEIGHGCPPETGRRRLCSVADPRRDSGDRFGSPDLSRKGACSRWHRRGCECWRDGGGGPQ